MAFIHNENIFGILFFCIAALCAHGQDQAELYNKIIYRALLDDANNITILNSKLLNDQWYVIIEGQTKLNSFQRKLDSLNTMITNWKSMYDVELIVIDREIKKSEIGHLRFTTYDNRTIDTANFICTVLSKNERVRLYIDHGLSIDLLAMVFDSGIFQVSDL